VKVVKIVLPGHLKSDAISIKNGTPTVVDGMLIVKQTDDHSVELGRFQEFQSYWIEETA